MVEETCKLSEMCSFKNYIIHRVEEEWRSSGFKSKKRATYKFAEVWKFTGPIVFVSRQDVIFKLFRVFSIIAQTRNLT